MTENDPRPSRHTFRRQERLLDDYFRVDAYTGSFERFDGSMSQEDRLLVFERGDSVGVLLFDPLHKEVILVEQFRLPTADKGLLKGWVLELPAGILNTNESPAQCARREVHEETGYQISNLAPVSTFFPSPGGCSERIYLFYAEVRRIQQAIERPHFGVKSEDVRLVRIPVQEFFTRLRNREFEDAKLIIAGYWLKDRLASSSIPLVAERTKMEFEVDLPVAQGWFGTLRKVPKYIGFISGDIADVKDIDVWINPLTSEMMLDKFSDGTISAVIRSRGAEVFPNDPTLIKADLIGDALLRRKGERIQVGPGKVLTTKAGALTATNRVKHILHAAVAHAPFGQRPKSSIEDIRASAANALHEISVKLRAGSVLIPMMGTGPDGLPVSQVAPLLLDSALNFIKNNPKTSIEKIYLLAYSEIDLDEVERSFRARRTQFKPHPALDEPEDENQKQRSAPNVASEK